MREIKLEREDVNDLIAALEGGSDAKVKWLLKFYSWCKSQDMHFRIQSLIKGWFDKKCREENWHKIEAVDHWHRGGAYPEMEWLIEEETIDEFVRHQMEWTKAYVWDDKQQKVVMNYYNNASVFLARKGKDKELLDYLNEKISGEKT